jgi:predicted transcriptional regulator
MNNWQEQAKEMLGYHWIVTLAHMADVSKRTVQRWNAGDMQIPIEIESRIDTTYKLWCKFEELSK